jgi:hypothetical protein
LDSSARYVNIGLSLDTNINNENNDVQTYSFNEFHIYDKYNTTPYNISSFLSLLGIENFQDIFTKKFIENWNIIFITRPPINRLLTGFIEIVDFMFANSSGDLFFKHLIEKYYAIYIDYNETPSLRNLNQSYKSNQILNEYVKIFDNSFFEDEHLSYWNTFVYNLTKNTPIYNQITFLDLDDKLHMERFPQTDIPESNRSYINSWIHSESSYASDLIRKSKVYLSMETYFYNKLLKNKI